jgi:hypothetical protein
MLAATSRAIQAKKPIPQRAPKKSSDATSNITIPPLSVLKVWGAHGASASALEYLFTPFPAVLRAGR